MEKEQRSLLEKLDELNKGKEIMEEVSVSITGLYALVFFILMQVISGFFGALICKLIFK